MIKIEIDASVRNSIADRHWKWMKKRFGIDDPKSSKTAKRRKEELYKLLSIKDDAEFEKLIKADLTKLEEFAKKNEWAAFTQVSSSDRKEFKKLKDEIVDIKKQLKNDPESQKLKKELKQKESDLSKYQIIRKGDEIFSYLGYNVFCDDGEITKKGEEKSDESWGGYDYCLTLNLKVCPYCNREYINTVDRIKLDNETELKGVRPDFDHFFPKSKYPFLSCSIFNLIPACKFCNQLKGDNCSDGQLIYPFEEEFGEQGRFEIDFDTGIDIKTLNMEKDINLMLNSSNDLSSPSLNRNKVKKQLVDNSNKVFRLIDIYNTHQDQIKEFVNRIRSLRGCGEKTYQSFDNELLELYKKQSGCAKEYAKKILLGLPTDGQEYPLRKMKNDILEQVGM